VLAEILRNVLLEDQGKVNSPLLPIHSFARGISRTPIEAFEVEGKSFKALRDKQASTRSGEGK